MKKITILTIISIILLTTNCIKKDITERKEKKRKGKMIKVRETGSWYSSDPAKLKSEIESYLKKVKNSTSANPIAIISPHAGYMYSGETAAYAFAKVKGKKYKRVIVIGPSHYYPMNNQGAVPDASYYHTPLGEIEIDHKFMNKLIESKYIKKDNTPFYKEHSVDNEIPFAQVTLKDFKIVPIILGQFDIDSMRSLAKIIKSELDNETLIIISSDFTHYGSHFGFNPFKNNVKENLEKLNQDAVSGILKKDELLFTTHLAKTGDTICGAMPISLLINLLPENSKGKLIKYSNSGDLTGDYNSSVSYSSIIFEGKWIMENKKMTLTETEKKSLLTMSRKVLESHIMSNKLPSDSELGVELTDTLKQLAGGFVTLHKNGDLRGCIGEIMPNSPIYEVVKRRTISASTEDLRFPAVTKEELKEIDIEISILTPPERVGSYKDIIIGKHGIIIQKNGKSAVFLPQVAPEQGWNIETTLNHLSTKAGLDSSAWKDGMEFEVFEAIVFGEKNIITK